MKHSNKDSLVSLTLSLILISFLTYIIYPLISADFTIVNESIAIPDFANNQSQIAPDKSIEENLIIQLLGGYKILEGFFFHHHMSVLLPVYYLDIGADRNIHQYGILTSYLILFFSNKIFNQVSINSYFHIIHSFLPIFSLSLMLLGLKIYKDKYLSTLLVMTFILSYILLGFLNFYLTPTISPIRQIFIPIIIFYVYKVFYDGEAKGLKYLYLFILLQCFVFIELSIFMIITMIIQLFLDRKSIDMKKIHISNLIVFIIIIFIFIFNNFNGDNYFSNFNFIFLGPIVNIVDLFIITALLSICMYIVSSSLRDFKSHLFIKIISGYSLLTLFYYIWNPAYNHLAPILYPFIIIILFFIDRFVLVKKFSTTLIVLLVVTSFTLTFAVKNYYSEKDIFYNSLTEYLHNYNINFKEKIDMNTTMNPEYINDSCSLINKYNKRTYMNMISIHDSYIPFMCNKANAKYDQLIINMVNSKIKAEIHNYFANQDLIFVDNIFIEQNSEIYYRDYKFAEDFKIKMNAIDRAKDLFKDLKKNFKLLEKGKIISVYKKVN
jgi:hypothetical protein